MSTLTANIKLQLAATLTSALDLGSASFPLANNASFVLTSGTGANQANEIFADQRTLAASATENLDLVGALTDALGASIAFTKIKALIIKASASNTNDVVVGGHGSAACASFFGDATDKVKVKPGGLFVLVAPDANGYAVTATTADMLTVANSGPGTSVTYDVIIIGTV